MKKAIAIIVFGLLLNITTTLKTLSEEFNYLEILLNNEIVLEVSGKKYRLQFKSDGRILEYYDGNSWDTSTWTKINDRGKFSIDHSKSGAGAVQSQTLQIDFSKMTWNIYGKQANGKAYDTTWKILSPKPKIAKKPKKKKPKKQTPDDNKVVAAASGSGFFVSNTGHIVTNHHVIDECKAVKVNFKGDEIEAKILAIDKTNDLAILKANINPSKVFAISNEDVSLLQDIIVAGFPLGKRVSAAIKTHKGSVSALAGFGDNYSNFQTDATINQGNSGGPVMDQKGNVVGIAVALMSVEVGQNIFFAVKSSTLKTFASSNGLSFLPPNNRPMSNKDLGQLITEATVFLECWMTVAKIKQIIV